MKNPKVFRFPCLLTAFLITSVSAFAQEHLVTKGGEVLKGKVVSRENGVIVFQSNAFGEIRVSEDAARVESARQAEQEASTGAEHAPLTVPGQTGKVDTIAGEDGEHARETTRDLLKLPDGMHLQAGLGLGYLTGENHGENYSANLEVTYDRGRYFNSIAGEYQYGQVNGERNTDEYEYKGRTVRYFGDVERMKYFALVQAVNGSNRVRLEDWDRDLYGGLGVDLIKNQKVRLRIASGYSSEWENFLGVPAAGIPDLPTIHRHKGFLYQDLKIRLGERFQLEQGGFYMLVLDDASLYDFKINSTLSYKLTNHLSLDLTYTYEFDNSNALGIEDDTSKLTLQLGYKL